MRYFVEAMKQYADFSGRASRRQYWMFGLITVVFFVACMTADYFLGAYVLTSLLCFALLMPSVSIAARRLHDTGRSGWLQLWILVPIIGLVVLSFLLSQEGDAHQNQYGPAV